MRRPPAWIAGVLLGLVLGSLQAGLAARARARPDPGGGAAAFLLAEERDPRRWSVRELRALPGIGESLARALVATRAQRAGGPFVWQDVPGIGPGRAAESRAWLQARGLAPEPFAAPAERYARGVGPAAQSTATALAALLAACGGAAPEVPPSAPDPAAEPAPAALHARVLACAGLELHVVETGASGTAAVVFLHGARYSSAEWVALGTLARLGARGVRALALDWPGSGASPAPSAPPDPAVLLSAFLGAAGIERAVLVGPSRGGAQALSLAAAGEARLAGLFLIAPAGAQEFQPGPALFPPTRLLWGTADDILSPEVGRALAARLPGARLELLTGAGHPCYLEQPEPFHARLEDFLAELGLLAR